MKKRTITVPIDKEAEKALNFDEATPNQLLELELKEEEFYELYESGLFELINKISGSNIDDYEDESVLCETCKENVIYELEKKSLSRNNNLVLIIEKIKELFQEAIKRKTGIYFYF